MMWRTMVMGLSVLSVACTHNGQFSSYDEVNSRVLNELVKISRSDGTSVKARQVSTGSDSTSWLVTPPPSRHVVATSTVRHLTVIKRGRGAWEGFRAFLIAGTAVGLLGFASGDDSSGYISFTAEEKLAFGIAVGAVYGALIGAPLGALIGSKDRYALPR